MKNSTSFARLSVKLPLLISALVTVCIVTLALLGYSATRNAIVSEASAKLQAVGEMQAKGLETLLSSIDRDLELIAASPLTREALSAFTSAFAQFDAPGRQLQEAYISKNPHPTGEKEKLDYAQTGTGYDFAHARYHPFFRQLQQRMGYYNVFLFDTDGNLVYSVFKELDYATNLRNGTYKDSGLGEVFRRAMDSAEGAPAVFEDYDAYAPSYGAPAAFIARPVFGPSGKNLGVVAYQMPIDEFTASAENLTGIGESGDAFIVGADGLMRTNSRNGDGNDILSTRVETEAVARGLQGERGIVAYRDQEGLDTMAFFTPLEFLGTKWVVIVKENEEALFSQLATLAQSSVITGLGMFTAMLVLTSLMSRSISKPLNRLVTSVDRIRKNDFDALVPATGRNDEIGDIAKAIDAFREGLAASAAIAQEAAFKGAAYETSGAPMFLTDTQFNITTMNEAAHRLMRERAADFVTVVPDFDPNDVVGKNMDSFHGSPGKQRTSLSHIEKLPFKTKISVGDAYLGLLVDKVLDRDGAHIGYIAEWKDQTYQMANQVVIDGIDAQQCRLEARLDGRIKFANAQFCQLLDKTVEDLVNADVTALIEPMDDSANAWKNVGVGESVFGKFRIGNGAEVRVIDGSLSSIPDQKGKPNGFLFLGVDVTEEFNKISVAEAERERLAHEQEIVVSSLRESLQRMATGDLTCTITTEFAQEYEQLRVDFNGAIENLLNAIQTVIENAGEIGSEANSISTSVGDLSKRTEQQAATLEQTAAAVEQLTTSVNSAAKGAKDAADIASAAREHAESSGEIVQNAVAAMNEIERSSNEISKIISVIDDIAFQTNLLALNAGVEAARAGESGRGFAVVASEVRALAQRSLEAASEINGLITASGESVEHGVSLVGSTGEALEKIVVSVAEISDLVNNIALSAAEQSSGISEINSAMTELDSTTQHNAAMAEETTAATLALAGETKALVSVTSQFHTGGAPGAKNVEESDQADHRAISGDKDHAAAPMSSPVLRSRGNLALDSEFEAEGWEDF